MKALNFLPLVFSILLMVACKNSHDSGPGNTVASPGESSGYEGDDDLDRHPASQDTSSIGGRTPAGSLTNEAGEQPSTDR